MFVKLKDRIINTNQICYIDTMECEVYFSGGNKLDILLDDIPVLVEELFQVYEQLDTQTKTSKPSEASALLNTLNTLLGGRGEAKMTTDRKARLNTRLKDFTPEELIQAAQNLGTDEFMQGANDNGKRYGTIDYLLRTSANVNKWLEDQPDKKQKSMF